MTNLSLFFTQLIKLFVFLNTQAYQVFLFGFLQLVEDGKGCGGLDSKVLGSVIPVIGLKGK